MKLRNKVTTSKGVKYELEKEVFTGDYWIDGKPIYVICKQFKTFENNTVIKPLKDGEAFIKGLGMIKFNSSEDLPIPFANMYTQQHCYIGVVDNNVCFKQQKIYEIISCTVCILFTKLGGVIHKLLSRFRKWGACYA